MKKRIFTAIGLPKNVKNHLLALNHFGRGVRWVREKNFHMTLKFIGSVDGTEQNRIQNAIERISFATFDLTIQGLGVFPHRGTPRVLWAGIKKNEELMILQDKIERELSKFPNLKLVKRKYHPHITLAKLKDVSVSEVYEFIQSENLLHLPAFEVSQFQIYSSFMTNEGTEYQKEAEYFSMDQNYLNETISMNY